MGQFTNISQIFSLFFIDLYQWIKKSIQELVKPGIYEVLEYQTNLEIHDTAGKRSTLSKVEKVRFLQDNISSYQDQVWGDGEILQNYRCAPGVPVDQYRSGHNTLILISLRGNRNKGDTEVFRIDWNLKNGFLKPVGFWETSINHKTKKITVVLTFPHSRPPIKCYIIESNSQKNIELGNTLTTQLPDNRWQLTWSKVNPRLHEKYILKWEW